MKWSWLIGGIAALTLSLGVGLFLVHGFPGQALSYTKGLPGSIEAQQALIDGVSFEFVQDVFAKQPEAPALPLRLRIPKIQLDASIEHVGLTPDGAMDTPKDPNDVAWLELGQRPGEQGSAVIAGHYGRDNGKGSAFDDLYKVRIGDMLFVQDDHGKDTSFVVRAIRRYDPRGNTTEVFASNDDKSHLNLITCEGAWNDALNGYPTRLVVFADKVE